MTDEHLHSNVRRGGAERGIAESGHRRHAAGPGAAVCIDEAARFARLLRCAARRRPRRRHALRDVRGPGWVRALGARSTSTSTPGAAEFEAVQAQAAEVLDGSRAHLDRPAARRRPGPRDQAARHKLDAQLIVVGTRKRGIGESIREFFTGSVAARLAHRQHRSVLVVPLGEPVPDTQKEIWPEYGALERAPLGSGPAGAAHLARASSRAVRAAIPPSARSATTVGGRSAPQPARAARPSRAAASSAVFEIGDDGCRQRAALRDVRAQVGAHPGAEGVDDGIRSVHLLAADDARVVAGVRGRDSAPSARLARRRRGRRAGSSSPL